MEDPQNGHDNSNGLSRAIAIDAICDRFEAALKAGDSPKIGAFLEEIDEGARSELFEQLLGLQMEVLQGDQRPSPANLLDEFPDYEREVANAFQDPSTTQSGGSGNISDTGWEPPDPTELTTMLDGYEVLGFIGRGGMGAVYKGVQTSLDRQVAIKLLPPELGGKPEFAARFEREAKAMARLNHPNIVQIHDFGRSAAGHFFFAMEFVDGPNLHQLIRSGKIEMASSLELVRQICNALEYAHREGLVHRDIKPANVFLSSKGILKVGDFGLAKLVGRESSNKQQKDEPDLTLSGTVMGTPHYMAPEQMGGLEVDHRADIYSVGVLFYEMLTGQIPRGAVRKPSECSASIDLRVDSVVFRAMDPDPTHRYQSAIKLRTDVDAIRWTPPPGDSAEDTADPGSGVSPSIENAPTTPVVHIAEGEHSESSAPGEQSSARVYRRPIFVLSAVTTAIVAGLLVYLLVIQNGTNSTGTEGGNDGTGPTAAGRVDTSFGIAGWAEASIGEGMDEAYDIGLMPNGKVLLIGHSERTFKSNSFRFAAARFNADGSPDEEFGNSGKAIPPTTTFDEAARGLAMLGGGKFAIAGRVEYRGYGYDFGMVGFSNSGELDTTFGSNGYVVTSLGSGDRESAHCNAVATDNNGRIVVAGDAVVKGESYAAVVRYLKKGSLDPTFGTGGGALINLPMKVEVPNALAIDDSDNLIIAGTVTRDGTHEFAVCRIKEDGSLDSEFGEGGIFITQLDKTSDRANGVAIQADGKIVVCGSLEKEAGDVRVLALRLNPGGEPDTTFGKEGFYISSDTTGNLAATDLAIDNQGRILMAVGDFSILRLGADGLPDLNFGESGTLRPEGEVRGITRAIKLDGKGGAYLAGARITGASRNFAVVKMLVGDE